MQYQEFTLTTASGRPFLCDVRYHETGKPKPVIVFVHGFKGFKDWGHFNLVADYFAEQGYVYVKLNLSHNGTTPGKPIDFADLEAFGWNTFSKELDDIGTLIDHLFSGDCVVPETEMSLNQLYLMGHSRGGGMVLLKTAEDERVKKVATLAALGDLEKRWSDVNMDEWKGKGVQYVYNGRTEQNMPMYYTLVEDFYANKERLDIPANMEKIDVPVLLTHGSEDETLSIDMVHALGDLNENAEVYVVNGANHVFGGKHPYKEKELPEHTLEVVKKIVSFFSK